ncbi:uncharacterized protein LY79DRAFT_673625 [Colletotrichum navitas]|uniref:Uncharacterized protein n=1 Tax=Colletotrichum navitas TaxID=681940 RepID=A0AAD8V0N0_9PEZI|nr:uncharacterized protein LY79DRAFT_673625 [Colletotrichum navitas]KAK1573434.1 hypothetical protein LY79DRAFT_673625 [Colletotrichum navitas]
MKLSKGIPMRPREARVIYLSCLTCILLLMRALGYSVWLHSDVYTSPPVRKRRRHAHEPKRPQQWRKFVDAERAAFPPPGPTIDENRRRLIAGNAKTADIPLAIEFLQSFMCLCTDYREINIHVIVSDLSEHELFCSALDDLAPCRERFSIFPVPPGNYQTIKKLAAAAALEYDWALWVDSESIVVQPFSARRAFGVYARAPTVWRSRLANRDSMRAIMRDAAGVLRLADDTFGPDFWNLESQQWMVEKAVLDDLVWHVEAAHGQDFWAVWAAHGGPFEVNLYNLHVHSRKLETTDPLFRKYRVLETEMEMGKYSVLEASTQQIKNDMSGTGLLERSFYFLRMPDISQRLSNMLHDYGIDIYRLDTVEGMVPEEIERFLLDTPVNMLCSAVPPLYEWWKERNMTIGQ